MSKDKLISEIENPQGTIMETFVDKAFYKGREEFSVLALTGPVGNGCEEFSALISQKFEDWSKYVRNPLHIGISEQAQEQNKLGNPHQQIKETVFKRKYTICHDFVQQHYKPYTTIKYNKVVMLYVLKWIIKNEVDVTSGKNLKDTFIAKTHELIEATSLYKDYNRALEKKGLKVDSFRPSVSEKKWDNIYNIVSGLPDVILTPFEQWDKADIKWEGIDDDEIQCIIKKYQNKKCWSEALLYNNDIYDINRSLTKKDYYLYSLLMHTMAKDIRLNGNPFDNQTHPKNKEHIFDLIELINVAIKSCQEKQNRRFCIDAIRNSLEARYMKERYTAFYFIAVHHQKPNEAIRIAINKRHYGKNESVMIMYAQQLAQRELKAQHKDEGFATPDVEQCVADAEIHILNQEYDISNHSAEFHSMAEQWMKYAALILHPGLITPSSEERCMEVAYTAKFNSGCVSRQVGAVITNKNHAIRSIGWNEVPYGQISCGLRQVSDLVDYEGLKELPLDKQYMYSDFELGTSNQTDVYGDGDSFAQKIYKDFGKATESEEIPISLCGLPHVFCFRELHNKYTGERNQVYGRSLHAEENAMILMAKSGGEGLEDGIIYVTASPCELCSRKLYQIGVRKIVYIDPYPGIAREQTIASGFDKPELKIYQGAFGATYYKLFSPILSSKDEVVLRCSQAKGQLIPVKKMWKVAEKMLHNLNSDIPLLKATHSEEEILDIIKTLKKMQSETTSDFKKHRFALLIRAISSALEKTQEQQKKQI